MTTKTFEVRGMNQVMTPRLIEKQLVGVPGVHRVDASYASQSATVIYDEAVVYLVRLCDRYGEANVQRL